MYLLDNIIGFENMNHVCFNHFQNFIMIKTENRLKY